MDNKTLAHCKILVSSPTHWDPLKELLNEQLGTEFNRLVYAESFEKIKEIQGSIRTIKWILSLPETIDHR